MTKTIKMKTKSKSSCYKYKNNDSNVSFILSAFRVSTEHSDQKPNGCWLVSAKMVDLTGGNCAIKISMILSISSNDFCVFGVLRLCPPFFFWFHSVIIPSCCLHLYPVVSSSFSFHRLSRLCLYSFFILSSCHYTIINVNLCFKT